MSRSRNPTCEHILWRLDDVVDLNSPKHLKFIEIEMIARYMQVDDDDVVMIVRPSQNKKGNYSMWICQGGEIDCSFLTQPLSLLDVPTHYQKEILLPEISKFIKSIAIDPLYNSGSKLSMGIGIDILTRQRQNEDEAAAISWTFRGKEGERECAICLENLEESRMEVFLLPCSHMYHKFCIDPWLNKSNLCPMCRRPVVNH